MSDEARKCWLVQWDNPPLPKEQWSGDRYWPVVEVYESWGDAFKRLGELRDKGCPVMFQEIAIHPADPPSPVVSLPPQPTEEPK